MAGYVTKDYARLLGAVVSPVTSAIIDGAIDMARVNRYLDNLPDAIADKVRRDFADVRLAGEFYRTKGNPEESPTVSPVASVAPAEQWISTAEAARILGKTPRTVTSYIDAGKLTAKRKDKKSYLVLRESVEALHLGEQAAA